MKKKSEFKIVSLLVVFGLLSLLVPYGFYLYVFSTSISSQASEWSNLGEFIGGVSGTILNFLTFIALIFTFIYQYFDSRKRDEQDVFFKLLDGLRQIITDTSYRSPRAVAVAEPLRGEFAFRAMYVTLIENFRKVRKSSAQETDFREAYKAFHRKNLTILGHYFRFVYNVLKFIDNSSLDFESKKQLVNFLKSSLSQTQLGLIFFNCIFGVGELKFKPLIEKYGLFDNLDTNGVSISKFKYKYNEKAFRN